MRGHERSTPVTYQPVDLVGVLVVIVLVLAIVYLVRRL